MHKQRTISPKTKVEIYLRKLLKKCKPEDKLPSIRQLKSRFGVSQSVVDKVVMQLVIENLIVIRRPRGLFKAEPVRPVINLLVFHEKPNPCSFYHEFLADLLYKLAGAGYRAELISAPDAIHKILETPNKEMVMTFGADWQDYSLVRNAVQAKNSIINLLPDFPEHIAPAMVIDDQLLMETQIGYLHDAGHRKIAYLHLKNEKVYIRAQNSRWNIFHQLGLEMNLELEKDFLISAAKCNQAQISEKVAAILNAESAPTAFLLGSDKLVSGVYDGIQKAGLTPGKEISVLGTDNRQWAEYTSPPLTSVGFDFDSGFEQLIKMIEDIEKGGEGEILTLPVKVFERKSVVKL
jgi:DNA-binding LacI/PurR family transcriptional regulator